MTGTMTVTPTSAAPSAQAALTVWLDYWQSVHVSAIDLGLERIRPVAEKLQLLQPTAHVVTVAGTNGKGSTTTCIAAIYQAAGQRVGLYQSPHIVHFNERVRINGQPVDDATLIAAFVQIEAARQACGLSLSFFEATTLAALLIFAEQACQVWVLEVGLGGRLDAVNLIDADVAVITNVDLDHVEWLGDSIEKIAFEKAGILRPQIPLIYADPLAYPQAVADQAQALGCAVYRAGQDYVTALQDGVFYYSAPACTLALPLPSLALVNVAAAITAVLAGAALSTITVDQAAIAQGISTAKIAGRFEVRQWQARTLILDVAHNVHGMRFLSQQLQAWRQRTSHSGKIHLVFSMLADKDMAGVVEVAKAWAAVWHVAPMDAPRAASLLQLKQVLPYSNVYFYANLATALQSAVQCSAINDMIVVCGSFHVLEAVCEVLDQHGT